jgi:hypothetical protein
VELCLHLLSVLRGVVPASCCSSHASMRLAAKRDGVLLRVPPGAVGRGRPLPLVPQACQHPEYRLCGRSLVTTMQQSFEPKTGQ